MDLSTMSDQELRMLKGIQGKPPEAMSDNDLQFLDAMHMKEQAKADTPGIGDYVQAAGQSLRTPVRGIRALGVGAEKALLSAVKGEPLPEDTLERMSAATTPEYVAQPGEKAGAAIGEFGAEAALTAPVSAPMKFARGVGPATRLGLRALRAGSTGAGLSASQQLEKAPSVDPTQTAVAATGAVLGETILAPSIDYIGRLLKGSGRVVAKGGTNMPQNVAEQLVQDPNAFKTPGTAASVQRKIVSIQHKLMGLKESSIENLSKARKDAGLAPRLETVKDALAATGKGPAMSIEDAIAQIDLVKQTPDMNPQEALQMLDEAKFSLQQHAEYAKGNAAVAPTSKIDQAGIKSFATEAQQQIDALADRIPAIRKLREAESHAHEAASLFEDLQKDLATEGKASSIVQRMAKGGEDISGLPADFQDRLKQLQKLTKGRFVKPLQRDMLAYQASQAKAGGFMGLAGEAVDPADRQSLGRSVAQAGAALQPVSRTIRQLAPTLSSKLSEKRTGAR